MSGHKKLGRNVVIWHFKSLYSEGYSENRSRGSYLNLFQSPLKAGQHFFVDTIHLFKAFEK